MKQALLLALSIFCMVQIAGAQIQKTLHQAFTLEGINQISLNIEGEYQLDKWPGNAMLVESQIELYDASTSLLKTVLSQGRYMLKAEAIEQNLAIQTSDMRKQPISKNGKQCYEIIKIRILFPEEFTVIDHQTLQRPGNSEATTSTQKEE